MRKILFVLLAAVMIGACGTRADADDAVVESRVDRPNVLMIAVDDLNDWVGVLGGYGGEVHTPNIDRLAARGMLFTNAHADAPVCAPSRTSILLGQRPTTTGLYTNGHWWRPHVPNVVTMPEIFRQGGYASHGGGKIFHHMPGFNPRNQWTSYHDLIYDSPLRQPGWEERQDQNRLWPDGFPLNNIEAVRLGQRPPAQYHEFDWGPFDRTALDMGDGQTVQWAQAFLEQQHDEPFFLAVGLWRPHMPWYAPREFFDLYPVDEVVLPLAPEEDMDDVPDIARQINAGHSEDWQLLGRLGRREEAVRAYLASISYADALVGHILDALDESPHADNTIIVLWSDHGWHLGEKEHMHKSKLWERATRVPFIIVAPGITEANQRSAEPVNLVDIYPTLLELCGIEGPPQQLDGLSLVPQLRNPETPRVHPALTSMGPEHIAVRTARWRYIRYGDGSEELYDHENDPNEWTNLAGQAQYRRLMNDLRRWIPANPAPQAPRKNAWHFDPETYTWQPRTR